MLKIKKHHPQVSFQVEKGQYRPTKREQKIISSQSVQTRPELENSKINAKKFQKLKNIIQASFQDETGKDRMKKREQKKLPSYPFELDPS